MGLLPDLLSYLSYTVEAQVPMNCTAHSGLGPTTSISNPENDAETCPQAYRMGVISHLR